MPFPSREDEKLQQDVKDLRQKIEGFDGWVLKNEPDRRESQRPLPKALSFQILDMRRRVRNLTVAASVPVALAIYGASQCGKSLLMGRLTEPAEGHKSSLGLSGDDRLADELSFVTDLNPQLGNEATAVVTRFTLCDRARTLIPSGLGGYPVLGRLFSRADLVKAIGRGFYTECAGEKEWTESAIREILRQLETQYPGSVDAEWRADLSEAYGYMRDELRDHLLKADKIVFSQMLLDAPLSPEGYVKLACHIFWEDWRPISLLFERLLKMRMDTFRDCEAVLMAWHIVHFILDTNRSKDYECPVLGGVIRWENVRLRRELGQYVVAYGGEGAPVELDLLQGVMSELQVPLRGERLKAEGAAVFAQADCLDIPGARTGAGTAAITRDQVEKDQKVQADLPTRVLKRGRVGLMFDKYAEELQATAVLYLQATGNLEARGEIATQINRWGYARFRQRWPTDLPTDERAAPSLFIGLTKLDLLMKLNPDPEAFQSWLGKELAEYFAGWINSYGGKGETFTNIYLLRYPGTMDEVEPAKKFDVQTWQRSFLNSSVVNRYVGQPEVKWEAAFEPGNAGLKLLMSTILRKLGNEERRAMLAEQAAGLRGGLDSMMRDLFVDPDAQQQANKRRRVADRIVKSLASDTSGRLTQALIEALHFDAGVAKASIREVREDDPLGWLTKPDFRKVAARALASWQRTRDWVRVCTLGRPGAGDSLDEQTLTQLASYLVEYLVTECLAEIADRLKKVQSLGSEAVHEVTSRRYAEMLLNDYLLTPGPRLLLAPDVQDSGLMPHQKLHERWSRVLGERLASAIKEGRIEVPKGNDELGRMIADLGRVAPALRA